MGKRIYCQGEHKPKRELKKDHNEIEGGWCVDCMIRMFYRKDKINKMAQRLTNTALT